MAQDNFDSGSPIIPRRRGGFWGGQEPAAEEPATTPIDAEDETDEADFDDALRQMGSEPVPEAAGEPAPEPSSEVEEEPEPVPEPSGAVPSWLALARRVDEQSVAEAAHEAGRTSAVSAETGSVVVRRYDDGYDDYEDVEYIEEYVEEYEDDFPADDLADDESSFELDDDSYNAEFLDVADGGGRRDETAALDDSIVEVNGELRLDVDGDHSIDADPMVTPEDAGAAFASPAYVFPTMDPADVGDNTSFLSNAPTGLSRRGRRIRLTFVGLAIALTLFALYAVGVKRFSSRFLPNTSIYGCDVSGLTTTEAIDALENETRLYTCDVKAGDFGLTVTGTDVSLERDEERMVSEARPQQSAYAWPVSLLFHSALTPQQDVQVNEEELSALVSRAADSYNVANLSGEDVTVEFDEGTGSYALAGTVAGKALEKEALEQEALESVYDMRASCTVDETAAFHAATPEDLPNYLGVIDNANRVRSSDIELLVNGEPVISAEAGQLAQWVSVVDGPRISVDEDDLRVWAEYSVAPVAFHVDDWNTYFLDTDAFVSEFSSRLAEGNVDAYELPCIDERSREGISRDKAYEHSSWNEEMGRYIDVDLEAQFARLFDEQGEVLWESAFVSGDMFEGHPTVEGTFNIYSKEQGAVLVGLDYNTDGKPDYQSFVNYWMPFYGGYGLHDATWRSDFGGDLYQYNGSHGCVNLPYEKARELFDLTYVGEVVYVHQ